MSSGRIVSLVGALVSGVLAIYLGQAAQDATHLRRADDAGRAKQYEQVLVESDKVAHAPADARALVARARALTALRQRREAEQAWSAAARRDPNNWRIHFEWANALDGFGDHAQARRRFLRAGELNPKLRARVLG